jgi:beta-galactosidase
MKILRVIHLGKVIFLLLATLVVNPFATARAEWETVVDGNSFASTNSFQDKWSYNYPWGTDHNGSARMDPTNILVSEGQVTITASPVNHYQGRSSKNPHLAIHYVSGTFYLKQQITINRQYPAWDISGQFKVPTQKGTWPAFWITGANSWPPESDFMEFKGSDGCNQNTYDGRWQGKITTVSDAESAWHTYRLVATLKDSTNVTFQYYIDGVMKTEQTAATFVDSPCWLIVDYQMEGSSGSPGPSEPTYFYAKNIVVKRDHAVTGTGSADGRVHKTDLISRPRDQFVRERISLDDDWRFIKADAPDAGQKLNYSALRAWILPTGNPFSTNAPMLRPDGEPATNISFTLPAFDDSRWRLVNLPHDFGIEGPFDQALPGGTGKLPWFGVAWYRKHLDIPAADAGREIYLDVDGAMSYATVWCNGKFVGGWPYGYASWRVDLTPYLKFGGDNVIAIRLNNPPDSSRWYPGGGIYRNVWLVKTEPVHVAHWGTYVTTPEASANAATVRMKVAVDNDADSDSTVSVQNEIFELRKDGKMGKSIASITMDGVRVPARGSQAEEGQIAFKNPKLWSLENPQRYVVVTSVKQDGKLTDRYETSFGIRTIEFTTTNGFLLNGIRVPIHGVCDHSDLGPLGTAINTRALARQIEILKSFGCNAIRTSHNPPAPELLDLCDKMGMLVMDESFDCWESGKTRNDYHLLFDDWHERDWRAELRRDRNHPSIILWSIGNEVNEQQSPWKFWIPAELTSIAHQEDPTRPTTAACNQRTAGFNGFEKCVDVFGYNYKPTLYGRFRQANPDQPLFGSETASCVSSRGEYFFPVTYDKSGGKGDFQVSSYDLYAPGWATPPDAEFAGQDKYPFVAGEFVWTGFDYLGEPTPYDRDESNLLNFTDPAEKAAMQKELDELGKIKVPARSSYFGIVDLDGFPKDRFYLYQSRWRPNLPMAHILPHWNWPERVGKVTPVHVYTSGDSAELFLNDKSLGLKKKGPFEYRLRWDDVVYQPGTLKVVAYKNGKKWATDEVKTTGPAAKLTLKADRNQIIADGKDLSFITVTVADKNGLLVPRSKNHIKFSVEGSGEIVATDDGDATSFESFQAPEHNAFNGLALVIVRAKAGQSGIIKLKAEADGLAEATIKIKSNQSDTQ